MFHLRVLPPDVIGMKQGQDCVQWQGSPLAVLNLPFVIPDCHMDGTYSGSGLWRFPLLATSATRYWEGGEHYATNQNIAGSIPDEII
jgi:hypothetical protein